MGTGSSSQNKVVKLNIPIIHLSGETSNNQTMQTFMYEGQQNLIVANPFSQVDQNYASLKNIYKDQKQEVLTSGIRVVHGLVGLQNLGNTCYFNTALHCLANTQPLMDYFLSKLHEKEINTSNPHGTKGEVALVFGKLISEVWRGSRSVGIVKLSQEEKIKQKLKFINNSPKKGVKPQTIFQESITPKVLITTVNKYSKMFEIGQQEDCQELLAYLLDMLHEDLNRCPKLKQPKPAQSERDYYGPDVKEEWAAESWSHHLQTSKSVIVDVFQGQLKSTLQCLECGLSSHKFEAFLFLSLPIPKQQNDYIEETKQQEKGGVSQIRLSRLDSIKQNRNDNSQDRKKLTNRKTPLSPVSSSSGSPIFKQITCTLQECLELFSIQETLSGSSQWFCPTCKHNVDAKKQIQLWKLPNVLIVHIKRFEFSERGGKINAQVSFPVDDLDLSEYVCSPQKEPPLYTLYAVAQHQGSMSRGHYTAAVKNRNDGEWYWYNDREVNQIMDINALIVNQYAYVLFYQKKTSEAIFRQTLSKPEKWPHFTNNDSPSPANANIATEQLSKNLLSKTLPVNSISVQPETKQKDFLVLDDYLDEIVHSSSQISFSEQYKGSSNRDINREIKRSVMKQSTGHLNFDSAENNMMATSQGVVTAQRFHPSTIQFSRKSIHTKQQPSLDQDNTNVFSTEVDLRNIQKKEDIKNQNQNQHNVFSLSNYDQQKSFYEEFFEIKTDKMSEMYRSKPN